MLDGWIESGNYTDCAELTGLNTNDVRDRKK
jgi:hypothetical protein